MYYQTPAVQLVVEDGRVTGVIGKKESNSYAKPNATKGVILSAGDYQNNDSMVERYSLDLVNFDQKQINKTGDGHLMSILSGGHTCLVNHSRQIHDADSGPMGSEPFLAVDQAGMRFMNEEITTDNWNDVLRTNAHPAGQFCHVFDSNYFDYATEWEGSPAPEKQLLAFVPDSGVRAEEGGIATGIVEDLIDTHRADSLDELAEMLRVPTDALKQSVARYNELCEKGEYVDYGKEKKYLKPIDTPPFWGIRRNIRITAICGGIAVNENYQV